MNLIKKVSEKFDILGEFKESKAIGDGHVNDTLLVETVSGGEVKKYVLQRINTNAFKNPDVLMKNIVSVLEYLKAQVISRGGDAERENLSVVYTREGKSFLKDDDGNVWRMMNYIAGSKSYTTPTRLEQIYESAYAFGKFQRELNGFPAEELCETIADFHNTPKRLEALVKAAESDKHLRLDGVRAEYEFAKAREGFTHTLEDMKKSGILPVRVTHNDTKLNNVLFDVNTDKPVCVVDLDTVMPGLSVNDFGDAVRSTASGADEDERDLTKVKFNMDIYEHLVRGFLDGTDGSLTDAEIQALPTGAIMMTLECGMRFLSDYLSGDVYFKTSRPNQNLDRARTQFELVRQMEEKIDEMRKIVNKYSQKGDSYDKNLLFGDQKRSGS